MPFPTIPVINEGDNWRWYYNKQKINLRETEQRMVFMVNTFHEMSHKRPQNNIF